MFGILKRLFRGKKSSKSDSELGSSGSSSVPSSSTGQSIGSTQYGNVGSRPKGQSSTPH